MFNRLKLKNIIEFGAGYEGCVAYTDIHLAYIIYTNYVCLYAITSDRQSIHRKGAPPDAGCASGGAPCIYSNNRLKQHNSQNRNPTAADEALSM